jgi:hypothetical protein
LTFGGEYIKFKLYLFTGVIEEGIDMKKVLSFRPFTAHLQIGESSASTERQTDPHPPPGKRKRIFCFLRGEAPAAVEEHQPETRFSKATYNVKSLRLFCSPFIKIRKTT